MRGCFARREYQPMELGRALTGQRFTTSCIVSTGRCLSTQWNLYFGDSLHAHVCKAGFLRDVPRCNHILNAYTKSGCFTEANKLFAEMPDRNLVSFSIMISAESMQGKLDSMVFHAVDMRRAGFVPNQFVFSSLLSACPKVAAVRLGKQAHAQVMVHGLQSDPYVKASLINMYSKFGDLSSATSTFFLEGLSDPVVFNSMLSTFVSFSCYKEIINLFKKGWTLSGFEPSEISFCSLIKACGHFGRRAGLSCHGLIVKVGFDSNHYVGASLVDMYGRLEDAESLEMALRCVSSVDLALYNAALVGLSNSDLHLMALEYFKEIISEGFVPNECTFSTIVRSCAWIRSLTIGKSLHCAVEKSRFKFDTAVNTALIDMYMKCGTLDDSVVLFNGMNRRNTISYNAMISGCISNGSYDMAMPLLIEMNYQKVDTDLATFVSLMGLSSEQRWGAYAHAIKKGFGSDMMVENALLDSLFKEGSVKAALVLFSNKKEKNVISWTTAISGLMQLGFHLESINFFNQMTRTGVNPNRFTFSSVLKACGSLTSIVTGRSIHGCCLKHGMLNDEYIGSSLLDMYSKCGGLNESYKLFDEVSRTDIVCWNTLISGYAQHGHGQKALAIFFMMENNGIEPNHVTFLSLLSACSHCGLVDDGIRIFELMVSEYNITPLMAHFASVVDLFGRAGMLDRAKSFIDDMPVKAEASIWKVFLSACKLHGQTELAQFARKQINESEDDDSTMILIANMYSEACNWDDAENSRKRTLSSGPSKNPGLSWVPIVEEPIQLKLLGL